MRSGSARALRDLFGGGPENFRPDGKNLSLTEKKDALRKAQEVFPLQMAFLEFFVRFTKQYTAKLKGPGYKRVFETSGELGPEISVYDNRHKYLLSLNPDLKTIIARKERHGHAYDYDKGRGAGRFGALFLLAGEKAFLDYMFDTIGVYGAQNQKSDAKKAVRAARKAWREHYHAKARPTQSNASISSPPENVFLHS